MKKYIIPFAILALLFACAPEDKNDEDGGWQNYLEDTIITGDALEITKYSASLTGYAYLPLELGDAEVGIMYDKNLSFEDAQKIVATKLDGNYKFSITATGLSPNTTYYYKSYVQNEIAIKYGAVKSFTTPDSSPVEGVSLDKTIHTFHTIGGTLNLTATVLPADASDKSVEWSSSNDDIASVDQSGNVTAMGNGKATITVTTKDQSKTATCEVIVAQWVTSISLDKASLALAIRGQAVLSVMSILPENAENKSYSWSSSNNAVVSVDNSGKVTAKTKGNTIINATANDGSGVCASCSVAVFDFPQAVDMGIVVNGKNIKWAASNLGASSPEDYGLYFAWGETEPKSYYCWRTYKFSTSDSESSQDVTFSKYNTKDSFGPVDNKTKLDPEDDVAHVKLGGNWRMPTNAEWTALRTQCTCVWTTQDGINGRMVIADNGNSIFLPAAGFRNYTSLDWAGATSGYWSSSLYVGRPIYAWLVGFDPDDFYGSCTNRYLGSSIRPVYEE